MTIDVNELLKLLNPEKPIPKPKDGLSAYDIWLSLGNEGTEEDYIKSLQGSKGEDGIIETVIKEVKVKGDKGDKGDPGTSIKGDRGLPGAKGDKGDDGDNGISIENAEVNQEGDLIITYSDGRVENAGHVRGADGLMTGGGGGARRYADETFLSKSLLDDKGDILTSDGTNEYVLPVGAIDGVPLRVDSSTDSGLKYGYGEYTSVSDDYSVLPRDYHIETDTAGITITLEPPTSYVGREIYVDNNSDGNITLTSVNGGSDAGFLLLENGDYLLLENGGRIDFGATPNPLTIESGKTALVVSNGSQWRLKEQSPAPSRKTITNADSPYNVLITDRYINVDASSGAVTVNLLPLADAEKPVDIKKVDSSVKCGYN